jgi:hypothetical protein
MKKFVAMFVALGAFLGFGLVSVEAAQADSVKIYRLYNPGLKEHLYTSDANEKNELYSKHGWGYEGVAWYAPSNGKPVYRLYSPQLRNHLYTTDTNEVKVLTSQYGWTKDNGGKPLFYSGGKTGIYRLYNASLNGMHMLTTDGNEYKILSASIWDGEGAKLSAAKIGNPIKTQYKSQASGGGTSSGATSSKKWYVAEEGYGYTKEESRYIYRRVTHPENYDYMQISTAFFYGYVPAPKGNANAQW